jgi:hypothetical protein
MNVNGNLENGIGIQMSQIKTIEIKEATKKGRNRKSETAEKKRNINHGFVGILCRDSDPWQIRQEQSSLGGRTPMDTRWRRSGSETTDIWLPAKGNWLLGSMGGITAADELEAFRLGAISTPLANRARAELQRGYGGKKTRTRARKAEAAESAIHMGYSRVRYRFQKKRPVSTRRLLLKNTGVPRHHPVVTFKTPACHVITRRLLIKHRRAMSSPDGYF